MIKWFNVTLLFACAISLGSVYFVKYKTQQIANEKQAIVNDIARIQSGISILKADWTYLNQPSYIEPVVLRHQEKLGLVFIEQEQFINIKDLPMRAVTSIDDAALTALFEALDSGVDPIAVLIEVNSQ
jgi:hypothetical protein